MDLLRFNRFNLVNPFLSNYFEIASITYEFPRNVKDKPRNKTVQERQSSQLA